ncbi:hypothetical protein Tco_0594846 [Tanacetum coccineum]
MPRVTLLLVPRGLPAVTGTTTRPPVNGGDQRWPTAVNGGNQRRSQWRTTVDHRRTTGQRSSQAATWHVTSVCRSHVSPHGIAMSVDWVPLAHVAATSAADMAEGIITLLQDSNMRHGGLRHKFRFI